MFKISKKLSFVLAFGLSLLALTSEAACRVKSGTCRGGGCKKATVVRSCRGSSCKKAPSVSTCKGGSCKKTSGCAKGKTISSGGCCRRTTTTIIYRSKGKKSGCRRPIAPGRYHYNFERRDFTNGIERISVPFPQRSRTR